jgi:hypothetical protein
MPEDPKPETPAPQDAAEPAPAEPSTPKEEEIGDFITRHVLEKDSVFFEG